MSSALKNVVETGKSAVESGASTLSDLVDEARSRIEDLPVLARPRRRKAASALRLDPRPRTRRLRSDGAWRNAAVTIRPPIRSTRPASGIANRSDRAVSCA